MERPKRTDAAQSYRSANEPGKGYIATAFRASAEDEESLAQTKFRDKLQGASVSEFTQKES